VLRGKAQNAAQVSRESRDQEDWEGGEKQKKRRGPVARKKEERYSCWGHTIERGGKDGFKGKGLEGKKKGSER